MLKTGTAIFVMLISLLLLSGCDSDSDVSTSSDGGSGSTPPAGSTPPPVSSPPAETVSQFAGTYKGSATATASALGLSESESAPVTIIIDNSGTVTIQSGSDIFQNVTVLNSNTFSYTQSLNGQDLGSVTCTGSLTINGTISGGVINGTLSSSNVICNNAIPVTVTGTLKATRQ